MNKISDVIFAILMVVLLMLLCVFIGYEYRGKVECEKDSDFLYSLDYGRCTHVGKDNYK